MSIKEKVFMAIGLFVWIFLSLFKKEKLIPLPIEIIKKYAGKTLVQKNYDGNPDSSYYVGDFMDAGLASYIFSELETGESDITKAGAEFFNEDIFPEHWDRLIAAEGELYTPDAQHTSEGAVVSEAISKNLSYGKAYNYSEAPYPKVFSGRKLKHKLRFLTKQYGNSVQPLVDAENIYQKIQRNY